MQPAPPPPLDALDYLFEERRSRLSILPPELQEEIKNQVRADRAQVLSEQIVRAETENAYPLFLSLVTRFIGEAGQGELNPEAFHDPHYNPHLMRSRMRIINTTCLQFVEVRCMHIVSKMYDDLVRRVSDSIPPELDPIRECMMQLAERRNNKNKQATLRGNPNVEELNYSIQRVAELSRKFIQTSIRSDVTTLSQYALALLNECCDKFIMIIGNRDNTQELKKEAEKLLFEMLYNLQNIPQYRDSSLLSESVRAMYNIIDEKIKRAQQHGYQQGGRKISKSLKKQLKNNSNRHASKRRNKNKNSIHEKNKNRKKTLRLRFNK